MDAVENHDTAFQSFALGQDNRAFDVLMAFSQLETGRKMALFDQLMCGRANAYRNTMKSFWPQSNEHDAKRLEMVLRARLDRLQKVC